MSRNYVYLGKRVKDIGRKGLDHPKEYYGIRKAIVSDVRKGRISRKKGRGRLLLLYHLAKTDKDLKTKQKKRIMKSVRVSMKEI